MSMHALASRFTRSLFLSAGLVALSGILFALYVRAEAQVDRANELRYRSYVLADELRQSGDDLTRMVRAYVATGDPAYKQYFQEILDIRDGRKPRPENYARPYWDLVLGPGSRPRASGAAVPLLELMREAGFTGEEFTKLAQAKANSDALTGPELEAMRLLESAGPDAAASRSRAIGMLFDPAYHRAKRSVMQPIDEFIEAVDRRTLAAVQDAQATAVALRNALIVVALVVLFMLWRSYVALSATMGGSLGQVYTAIARIGGGDAPSAGGPGAGAAGAPGSVLAWLVAMKARLDVADRERDQAQDTVRREKQFAESLIHSMPGIFYLMDRNARFLRWNANFQQVAGYSDAEIAKLSPLDLFAGPDRELIGRRIQAVLTQGQADAEAQLVSRAGACTPYYFTGQRIEIDGQPCLIGVGQDISARKQAEDQVRTLNAELEQRVADRTAELVASNKDLEGFSYSISHDLRTPLRAVDNYSALLQKDHAAQLDEDARHLLDVIRRNTARMGRLIEDVLDFARAGKRALALEPLALEPLALEVFDELQPEGPCRPRFEVAVLPPAFADRALIRQVLCNLLGNAVKYSGKRDDACITLRGRVENGETLYEVGDNGVGFDARYAGKLFGVFQRLHTEDEFPGTGIGLAIVNRIVAKHGGRVWADGRPGTGATFGFSLPRREALGVQGVTP